MSTTERWYVTIEKLPGGNPFIPDANYTGYCDTLPEVGKRFLVILTEGRYPYLHTSEVKSVNLVFCPSVAQVESAEIHTQNSVYKLVVHSYAKANE